jgi:2-keto-4-pentenoate hydratase/2-oxohepta-3-ene-1,7-dioic acid hydratase in catechol pathway
MKICRFLHNNEIKIGAVRDESIYEFDAGDIFSCQKNNFKPEVLDRSKVKSLPPVVPSKIVCVGRNYSAHAAELGNEVPKEPLLFLKSPSAITTEGETIVIPPQSIQVEHEGELAVIIKKTCKNLTENDNSFEYILGYTCLNDVTARDLQKKDVQFTRAKSFDTFCPIGWFVETEVDVTDLQVRTLVNGVVKQDGRTSQMVFPVNYLVRYISNQMTLFSGDVIATGTPSGVSKLSPGDVCKVEIEGIGSLSNPVESALKIVKE